MKRGIKIFLAASVVCFVATYLPKYIERHKDLQEIKSESSEQKQEAKRRLSDPNYRNDSILPFMTRQAKEKNYCNDPDANMQWEALIQEAPDDMQIHALHALRLGLCYKVDRGDLTVDQVAEIFENMRRALIDANVKAMEEELEEAKKKGKGL